MGLLKEKAKEIKQTQKKLTKLEEKSVKLFKDNKLLHQDRKTFEDFLKVIFRDQHLDEILLSEDQLGLYDAAHLQEVWQQFRSSLESENEHIITMMQEQKQVLTERLTVFENDLRKKMGLDQKVKELEEANKNLSQKVEKLEAELRVKSEQLSEETSKQKDSEETVRKMKALEKENLDMKSAQLLSQFPKTATATEKQKIQQLQIQLSEKTNEILQLKQNIQDLKENQVQESNPFGIAEHKESDSFRNSSMDMSFDESRLSSLEQQVKEKDEETLKWQAYAKEMEQKLSSVLTEFTSYRNKAQDMIIGKDEELNKFKGRSPGGKTPEEIQKEFDEYRIEIENDKLSVSYIKNVFIKYLVYMAQQNEKEAKTMEKVLFSVLEADGVDIDCIEKARKSSNNGLWSYFQTADSVPKPVAPRQNMILSTTASPRRRNSMSVTISSPSQGTSGQSVSEDKRTSPESKSSKPPIPKKGDNRSFNINFS